MSSAWLSNASSSRPELSHRTLSSSLRLYRKSNLQQRSYGTLATHQETEHLLGETEHEVAAEDQPQLDAEAQETEQADSDGLYPPNCTWTNDCKPPPEADRFGHSERPIWYRIHQVHRDITNTIDDPYSLEQLKAPRMNISVVRPLVDRYYDLQDLSVVFCLLLNRIQFIHQQNNASHHHTVNLTRALLCEMVAEKVLRRYNEHNPGPLGLLKLSNILVAAFEPFQGAPRDIIQANEMAMKMIEERSKHHERKLAALEIAIVSESKSFLASSGCQRVVDAIYRGKIVYSPSSFIDIIPDHWKRRPISLYDPRRAPMLNQYRLIVPRTRNVIEVVQFIILLVLYVLVMLGRETRQTTKFEIIEAVFDFYTAGWVLDQIAAILEHGWQVYTQNLWSFLDVMFSVLFVLYFGFRMRGLSCTSEDEATQWARTALDILSCGAPVLVPRLAFNLMSDNILFLSLRAMMGDFLTLTLLAVWCFAGFLLSLKWLHNGLHHTETIAKWMVFIWFGLDGTGIQLSPTFHWFLGPAIMITFAFLGNTLFLTILVSMLSNTFSVISANAVQEIQFRKAVLTFMGVKSDAIFAFMPPFNLGALVILLPLKWILSPRLFHTVNVGCVRMLTWPMLVLISWHERSVLWIPDRVRNAGKPRTIDWKHSSGPRAISEPWWSRTFAFWNLSKFSVHSDIQAIFDCEPPREYFDSDEDQGDVMQKPVLGSDADTRGYFSSFSFRGTKTKSGSPKRPSSSSNGTRGQPKSGNSRLANLAQTQRRRKGSTDLNRILSREFADSGDEVPTTATSSTSPNATRPSSRTPNQTFGVAVESASTSSPDTPKTFRKKRKDSIIDYENPLVSPDIHEANTRFSAVEGRLERIESLLLQILDAGAGGSSDEGETQEQLARDVAAETAT